MSQNYSKNFLFAVSHTLQAEGVFTVDTGGRTKYGITEDTWKRYGDGTCDITQITVEQATSVYWAIYWFGNHLDEVNNRFVAAELFDSAVNCGSQKMGLFAQAAYNYTCQDKPQLKEDWIFGRATRAAINDIISSKRVIPFLYALNGEQYLHYRTLVRGGTKYDAYARGWTRRLVVYEEAK